MNTKISLLLGILLGFATQALFAADSESCGPLPAHTVAMQARREAASRRYNQEKTFQEVAGFHAQWTAVGMFAGMGVAVLPACLFQGYRSSSISVSTEVVAKTVLVGGVVGYFYSRMRDLELKEKAIDKIVMTDLQMDLLQQPQLNQPGNNNAWGFW